MQSEPRYLLRVLGRPAIIAIPVIAVAATAAVLLGPGALGPAYAARVYGAPTLGSRVAALRIETLASLSGVDERVAMSDITVEARIGERSLDPFTLSTGPDGIAEARLEAPEPIREPIDIRLRRGRATLAQGRVAPTAPAPLFAQLGLVRGSTQGELSIRVDAARGILAAPFPEALKILVTQGADDRAGVAAELEVSALGAEVLPARVTTDARGAAAITVKALAHQADMTIVARAAGKTGRWEGTLPVVPGAIWLDPNAAPGALALVSPAPRDRAYVSVHSDQGRVFGASVPLTLDPSGYYRGETHLPPLPAGPRNPIYQATLSGDPLERGPATVAWPLPPATGAVTPAPIERVLDGLPAALAAEKARAWAARRVGLLVIGAAALCEVLLILLQSRAAVRHPDEHLRSAASSEGGAPLSPDDQRRLATLTSREHPLLLALAAAAIIALGFALFAAITALRR